MSDVISVLMSDVVLELFRALVLLILVVFLWKFGAEKTYIITDGWRLILIGFLLILFGSFLDVTDNFESLNPYVVVGDTKTQAFLEKVVGYLFGYIFLTAGLVRWAPTVEALMKKEVSIRKTAEERSHLLLNAVGDGVIGTDVRGIVTFSNPTGCKLLGYSEEELVGHLMHEKIQHSYSDGSHYPFEKCPVFATIINGSVNKIEDEVFWRKNGSSFPAEYTSTPIHKDGNMIGAVITLRDVSERQAVEKAKTEFLSVVSHELRTPLTSIKGGLQLIKTGTGGNLPEQANLMLDIALKNSDRLAQLINNILDFDKIQLGKMELKMEPFDCNLLIQEASQANAAYADQVGVTFKVTGVDHPVILNGSYGRLMQVMDNLLSNAAKHSNKNGVVEIILEQRQSAIRISVKDIGTGIPAVAQPFIFDKFTQVDSSDTRAHGGSGLGLSIAKSIVEHHGGEIGFTSELGKGSAFYIEFPANVESSNF